MKDRARCVPSLHCSGILVFVIHASPACDVDCRTQKLLSPKDLRLRASSHQVPSSREAPDFSEVTSSGQETQSAERKGPALRRQSPHREGRPMGWCTFHRVAPLFTARITSLRFRCAIRLRTSESLRIPPQRPLLGSASRFRTRGFTPFTVE